MRTLYPEIEPIAVYKLDVEPPHTIYVEECGNKEGIPLVFFHGGPGSGCKPYHRQFFDPRHYRMVLFDQRGAGRSTPRGEVVANTTQALLDDIELIRAELNIDRWLLFGGSWGATLALRYALAHPERVSGLILRGLFLASGRDFDWLFTDGGVSRIFPDYWEDFLRPIAEHERDNLVTAYYRRIHTQDKKSRIEAARAWSAWLGRVVYYLLPAEDQDQEEDLEKMLAEASIETHYAYNRYFLEQDYILSNAHRLPKVPTMIIHGRRDLTCTLDSSWALHKALPNASMVIVPDVGHLAGEPAMIDALLSATDEFCERL